MLTGIYFTMASRPKLLSSLYIATAVPRAVSLPVENIFTELVFFFHKGFYFKTKRPFLFQNGRLPFLFQNGKTAVNRFFISETAVFRFH